MTESPATSVPPLFSPLQIAVASLIGGPVPACWFFACNYRALGRVRSARNTLAWGGAGMIALMALSFYLPPDFPRPAIPIGYTIGLYQTANQIHGAIVRDHLARGGLPGSWRNVIGVSLVCLTILLLVVLGLASFVPVET